MSPESLPVFRYHPDPIATGSIVASQRECRCCGVRRGYVYTGPTYAVDDLEDDLCPWCIANGSAHERFDAVFTDPAGIGGYGTWVEVSDEILQTVAHRTPGFSGWQQERWFTHCADAGAFLGAAGRAELAQFGGQAIDSIREEIGYAGPDWDDYFAGLRRDQSPTAYVFRCLHCGQFGGYSDFT